MSSGFRDLRGAGTTPQMLLSCQKEQMLSTFKFKNHLRMFEGSKLTISRIMWLISIYLILTITKIYTQSKFNGELENTAGYPG